MFVQLAKPHITIQGRTYPKGSVVEVDELLHKRLVDDGHAIDHPGPAGEPGPASRPAAGPSGRQHATERAVSL